MVLGDEVFLSDSRADERGDRGGAGREERRRYRRFRLELSVNVHLGGRPEPVTVEIVDIAARGVRFRSPAGALAGLATGTLARLLDEASFGFVSREQHICVAHGRILRVAVPVGSPAAGDEFVVSVERANAAFHSFLASLAA